MIWVILGICVVVLAVGILLIVKGDDWDTEITGGVLATIGAIVTGVTIIATMFLASAFIKLSTVDDQIAMYEEENTRIEDQISAIVKEYQEYESGIFADAAPDSSITLVSLYPELKSDILVQKQISIYTSNNAKIKELKEEKIAGRTIRWWLYFGK